MSSSPRSRPSSEVDSEELWVLGVRFRGLGLGFRGLGYGSGQGFRGLGV